MFKVGDKVKCINNDSLKNCLTINKIYIIEDCHIERNSEFVTIEKDDLNSRFSGIYSRRFILDVKELRKQKLKEICSKSEIK